MRPRGCSVIFLMPWFCWHSRRLEHSLPRAARRIRLAGSSASVRCCGRSAMFCRNTLPMPSLRFLVLTFLLLLFPNGHLPSPRWRFLAWLIAVLLAVYSITFLLSPYPYANSAIDLRLAAERNPMGILVANDLFDQLGSTTSLLLYSTIPACIVSVFLRF